MGGAMEASGEAPLDLDDLRRQATLLIGYVELLAKNWDKTSDDEKRELLKEAEAASRAWKAMFEAF